MLRLLCVSSLALLSTAAAPEVSVAGLGTFVGTELILTSSTVDAFLGVQYASAERFESPIAEGSFEGTKQATHFGATCPGSYCFNSDNTTSDAEQCLFLNVYRPSGIPSTASLPVMLFIHGGGYQFGCSNTYRGENLVDRSDGTILVVTINYRLNAFGFLGSDKLRSKDGATGTWGFQDQRAAMLWVNKYIRSFGGDPDKVTIFGQSAGASSVSGHMTSPKSRKYFRKMIAQSGLAPTWTVNSLALSESHYATFLGYAKCDDAACLKGLSMEVLLNVSYLISSGFQMAHSLSWAPVIDGVEFTKQPWQSFEEGDFAEGIDIISGTNRDEIAFFMLNIASANSLTFNTVLSTIITKPKLAQLAELRSLYSTDNYSYPEDMGTFDYWWWATMSAMTDGIFTCASRRGLRWMNKKNPNMYSYFAVHPTQEVTDIPGEGPGNVLVGHCADLPYVFNCPLLPGCIWTQGYEAQLSRDYSGFFVNFAKTGVPGGNWTERYNATADTHFVLDMPKEAGGGGFRYESKVRAEACDFWDKNLYA